ncbi:MAG: lytic murein transglycosylase [Desulfuromonadaceae bacterium]|nr:lytic murein transglycosylase [Desulfuromonadaceae bacterium]
MPVALGLLLLLLTLSLPQSTPAETTNTAFQPWLEELRQEALAEGIHPDTLAAALATVKAPRARVLHQDRHQAETKEQTRRYLARRVDRQRIEEGRTMLKRYPTWLGRMEQRYGIPHQIIVALWGLESHYGRHRGNIPVFQALATLAYNGRRPLFRRELIEALHLLDQKQVSLAHLTGSWAGAMGQCQFLPSSFRHYAADGNGDGRRDIWGTLPDVFASIANYLKQAGWCSGQDWGQRVQRPDRLDSTFTGLGKPRSLYQWHELGVRQADGSVLPPEERSAALIEPDGPDGNAYLVYDNFHALLRWNRSIAFALAVGTLADALQEEATPR